MSSFAAQIQGNPSGQWVADNPDGNCLAPFALKTADIIVSTTAAADSRAIRVGTSSLFSHAMLYDGAGKVIEAIGEGVVRRPLATELSHATLAVALRRKGMTESLGRKVVLNAVQLMSSAKGYDVPGAIGAGLARMTTLCDVHVVLCAGVIAAQAGLFSRPNRFYCSQLVTEAFRRAGVPIINRASSASIPQDIIQARSEGVLEYLGDLVD